VQKSLDEQPGGLTVGPEQHRHAEVPPRRDGKQSPRDGVGMRSGAVAAADCIVTGDKDLLVLKRFRSVPILTPRDFSRGIHEV